MLRSASLSLLVAAACSTTGVSFQPTPVGVAVRADGGLFADYRADGKRGPVLWPLCAVGDAAITRAHPLADVEGERRDHPHHESCWFTHGAVDGVDFWAGSGEVVAVGEPEMDAAAGILRQGCEWRRPDGRLVCRDQREYRFRSDAATATRTIDVSVRVLAAADRELHFGDTKEGTMALRLRNEFCLDGKAGAAGSVVNSEGVRGKAVWGKAARWVAYSAELDGVPHVVAMFDAPGNHGHPSHWHARDYGLFAANPFGLHDFTGAPPGTGDLAIPAGGALTLRYRIWIRRGTATPDELETAWTEFDAAADR
ncbi:MAG: PmoA family protein [Planctomycetes bacterium]|nr:PmoA family protein [Planctomycetota bacterium]